MGKVLIDANLGQSGRSFGVSRTPIHILITSWRLGFGLFLHDLAKAPQTDVSEGPDRISAWGSGARTGRACLTAQCLTLWAHRSAHAPAYDKAGPKGPIEVCLVDTIAQCLDRWPHQQVGACKQGLRAPTRNLFCLLPGSRLGFANPFAQLDLFGLKPKIDQAHHW
jgi:hypothetical protein